MKIDDRGGIRGTGGAPAARPAGKAAAAYGAAAHSIERPADSASVMGLTPAELTPKVREAITKLMEEVDRLRRELDQNRARIAYLEKLADQDSLAPVANRRAFVRELTRFTSFAERYGTPSSIIYLDVNDLKDINDTYGHSAGDAALVKIADLLVGNVRKSDVVGRMGGDEFAILLTHANKETAIEKARSIVEKLRADPLVWNGKTIPLSAAYGVHTFLGGENVAAALDAADREMYARKQEKNGTG